MGRLNIKKKNRKKMAAAVLCGVFLCSMLSGCGQSPRSDKTTVTLLYSNDFKNLEQLVESTYPDIDLQCERTPYPSEQLRQLEKGVGPDLLLTSQPTSSSILDYALDLSDTKASVAYDGTVMELLKQNGKTYLLPLPGQYKGYIVNETLFQEAGLALPTTNQELVSAMVALREKGIGVGGDGVNFSIESDYNTDLGMFFVGDMVPDFLGTVSGVQWMAGFREKKTTFSGQWEGAFDLASQLTAAGVMDGAALGKSRNSIRNLERMADGTLAVVFGGSDLYTRMVNENRENAEAGTSPEYRYRMLPLLSDAGNSPWLILAPSAYIGINTHSDIKTQEACRQVLELISTKEGQEALTRDIQMGYSYLKDYQPEHSDVITGLEEYVDSSYVYNVQFPDKIVEYLGEMSRQVFVGKLTPEDALKAVDKYYYEGSDQVDYDLSVVGTIKNDLLLQDYNTRRKEAEIGNLLADSVAEVSGASIAVVNGGGIRGSLYAGEVYGSDLAAVCPFDNQVVVLEMNGQVLWDMLENSLSACTDAFPGGRFLQVSGIRYTFDSSKEPGARLKSVTLADGTTLDRQQKYQVAVNDYMAGKQGYAENNGDGYTMLNVYSGDIPKGSVRLVKETDLTYRDALAQYFENHRNAPVSAELEGRITDTGKSE
ncbi:hypothetical protein CMETHOX_04170 [Lacrimispora indolis]|nr:hypothetical protein CMETHOX_04170 [[Clostridium] methoxybenzovorans]